MTLPGLQNGRSGRIQQQYQYGLQDPLSLSLSLSLPLSYLLCSCRASEAKKENSGVQPWRGSQAPAVSIQLVWGWYTRETHTVIRLLNFL